MRSSPLILGLLLASAATLSAAGSITISASDQKQAPVDELIVWLTPLDSALPALPAAGSLTATVEQKDKEFNPYTLIVRTGTTVQFPNLDDVQHHVYSLSRPAQFEIPLHSGDQMESVTMEQAGLVPVGCNIHDWMLSYIVVVDTPWFGKTATDGAWSLNDLPAGRYKLEAWHPRLRRTHEEETTIAEGGTTTVSLELRLRPDRRIRRAPDAGGRAY